MFLYVLSESVSFICTSVVSPLDVSWCLWYSRMALQYIFYIALCTPHTDIVPPLCSTLSALRISSISFLSRFPSTGQILAVRVHSTFAIVLSYIFRVATFPTAHLAFCVLAILLARAELLLFALAFQIVLNSNGFVSLVRIRSNWLRGVCRL